MLKKDQWKQVGLLLTICLIGGGCLVCVSGCAQIKEAMGMTVKPAAADDPEATSVGAIIGGAIADGLSGIGGVVGPAVETPMGGTMAGILALLAAQKGGRKTVAAVRRRRSKGGLLETKT